MLEIGHLITGASPMGNSDSIWVKKKRRESPPVSAFVKGQLKHLPSYLFTTCDLDIEVFFLLPGFSAAGTV